MKSKKTCSCCKIEKSITEFYNDKKAKDGLTSQCKTCRIPYSRGHRKKQYNLATRYGMSLKEYNDLCIKQNKKCVICDDECSDLVVDHNHITGKVRGLLCKKCNLFLGVINDNPEKVRNIVANIIEYIKTHS